jgi:putative colanic acid biosynthesis UDP-glucose lipid carrier transferase
MRRRPAFRFESHRFGRDRRDDSQHSWSAEEVDTVTSPGRGVVLTDNHGESSAAPSSSATPSMGSLSRPGAWIKRAVDLAIAAPLCIIASPLLLAVAVLIRWESPGPALFRQQRRGLNFEPFTMLKFRSMRTAPDPHRRYETQKDDPRITRLGAFLRRSSIDELPQLLNVLAGSMSLVGPRPLVEWESQEARRTHGERFAVKPGLTGWSQITVRNSVGFEQRLDKDVEYVQNWTLWRDVEILCKTPRVVLFGDNLYPPSS